MKAVLFVHPTMSEEFVFQTVRQRGYKIFSIITSLETTHIDSSLIRKHSDAVFMGSDSPERDFKEIQQIIQERHFQIIAVINGIDASLYYTDFLQKKLLHYDLDLAATQVRLNKYAVNRVLSQHHLPHIPSVEILSKTDLVEQAQAIQALGLPIIAKPSEDTAGMSSVELISSMGGVTHYLDKYLHKPNMYYPDKNIEKIILQQYIPTNIFEEYIIDFISYDGEHYCTSIMHYAKETRESKYRIYRYWIPHIADELPHIGPVIAYVAQCLSALKVRYGFTHNEVFWDRDKRFYLVESNSRMAGNAVIEIYQNIYGYYPLSQYLDLLEGKAIQNIPNHRKSYSMGLDVFNFFTDGADRLHVEDLKSFQKIIHFRLKTKTDPHFYRNYTRVASINACILLSNPSKGQLDRDVHTILSREADGSLFFKSK